MFCGHCGTKLEENSKFCGECGSRVGASDSASKVISSQTVHRPKIVKDKKKFRRLIISLLILVIIIGGGFIGLKYIQDINSAERLIDNFYEGIKNQDAELLKNMIVFDEEDTSIEDTDLQYLLNYYDRDNKTLKDDIKLLKEIFESGEETDLPYYVSCQEGVLFDKCSIKLAVRELIIQSTLENVEVALYRGDQIVKDEVKFNEAVTNLLPGTYEIHITSLNELTPFTLVQEVDLFKSKPSVNVEVENDLNENEIISVETDAIIFIDGKSTEKTAAELGTMIGLADGVEVYGVFKFNNQEIKSNVVTIQGSGGIELNYDYVKPPTTTEAETEIKYVISEYLRNFATAVNYNRFSAIEPYLLKDSELYTQQKSYISKLYERQFKEEYLIHEILDFTYDETTMTGTVKVEESYMIEKILEDSVSNSTYESLYKFVYDEASGKFLLTNLIL